MSTMRAWGVAAIIACAAGVWLEPPRAEAQASSDEEARRHFRLGQAHYENGSFLEAAQEFEQAYRLSNRPQLLYNIYVAYRDAGDLVRSRDALRLYLELVPNADNASMLRARLESLDRMLASQPSGGGDASSTGQTHETEAQQTQHTEAQQEAASETEAASTTAAQSIVSEGEADEQGPRAPETGHEEPATPPDGGSLSPAPFIVMGAGAALLVGGAITGGLALSSQSTLEGMCPNRACPAGYDYASEASTGKALAITTDVLLATGGTALVAGIVWLAVELGSGSATQSTEEPPVTAACGSEGCILAVRGEL